MGWRDRTISHADKQEAEISPNTIPKHLQLPDHLEIYNDSVVRRIIEKTIVLDTEHLLVTFKGGFSVEQIL